MAIDVTCPSCGNRGFFPDEWAGRTIECPRCRSGVPVVASTNPTSPSTVPTISAIGTQAAVNQFVNLTSPAPGEGHSGVDTLIPLVPSAGPIVEQPKATPVVLRWLDAESRRFEAHVHEQLGLLRKQRHDLTNAQSQWELKLLGLQQDASRRDAELDAKGEQLREREEAIAKQRSDLERAAQELADREQELVQFHQRREEAEKELAGTVEEINMLREESNTLRETIKAGRLELAGHRERRQDMEARQAALSERTAVCERREAKIEREELALRQRNTEVQEYEAQVDREIAERNRELDAWKRLLDEREKNFAQRLATITPPPRSSPRPVEAPPPNIDANKE